MQAGLNWLTILKKRDNYRACFDNFDAAIDYAKTQGAATMTVETLAPAESDENYLKTYRFYEQLGFKPLFNLKPANYEWNMVYMTMHLN